MRSMHEDEDQQKLGTSTEVTPGGPDVYGNTGVVEVRRDFRVDRTEG
jgi:hypothetical protein